MSLTAVNDRCSELLERLRELKRLGEVLSLLHWDQQTKMPHKAAAVRGEQISLLRQYHHDKFTSDSFAELVNSLADDRGLPEDFQVVTRELLQELKKARAISSELVKRAAEAENETHTKWLEARAANDYSLVSEALAHVVSIKREIAAALDSSRPAYDVLVDGYERGLTKKKLGELFTPIEKGVKELVGELHPGTAKPATFPLSVQLQKELCRRVSTAMGFDYSRGRLDATVHPFASEMGFDDHRLTTRFKEEDFFWGLTSLIHEAGHGLYEQGFNRDYYNTPLAEACSLGIHESQSLLWEKHVGHSFEFLEFVLAELRQLAPEIYRDISPELLWYSVNEINPGLLRLETDELHYALHIVLRTGIEGEIIENRTPVSQLRELWNDRCREVFGAAPKDDLEGVLQDVHWYIGAWGYFPCYLLGAMGAAQLYSAFSSSYPDAHEGFRRGECRPLLNWLREQVHCWGKRYSPEELMIRATGKNLSPEPLLNHFKDKLEQLKKFERR